MIILADQHDGLETIGTIIQDLTRGLVSHAEN